MPDWLTQAWGPIPAGALLGLLVALVASSPGFVRVVYFISTGYAGAITLQAVVAAWLFRATLDVWTLAQLGLLSLYGVRLGTYLVGRERSPSYRKELDDVQQRAVGITRPIQLAIWVTVSLLYVAMFYPALTNLAARGAGSDGPGAIPVGIVIMLAGLGLESWADRQKSRFKKDHPDRFCDVGLFRWVRCPNYLGEMVFWVGQFVAGVTFFAHWSQWLVAAVGAGCIQLIMVGSTRRLELKQDGRYGERDDYQAYVKRVPVLLPFVPLYSVKNAKIYLG